MKIDWVEDKKARGVTGVNLGQEGHTKARNKVHHEYEMMELKWVYTGAKIMALKPWFTTELLFTIQNRSSNMVHGADLLVLHKMDFDRVWKEKNDIKVI